MLVKRVMTTALVNKSTEHDKPHFDLFFFLPQYQRQRKYFFRAQAEFTRAAWYGLLSTMAN